MSNLYTNESPPRQSDKFEFLNLRLLPGKVDYRQAGYILAFEPVAIQRLVALGYLKPLGNNAGTEHKYFSTQRKAPASITDQKRFADELPSIKADGGGQFGGKRLKSK
jgi:hypothetical protein